MLRCALFISLALTHPAAGLELAQCDRVTHAHHGGEERHMDLGGGYVSWHKWWAQEGVSTDLHVADCRGHRIMSSRLREERVTDRTFDRVADGVEVLDRFARRSTAFFSLEDLARDLDGVGRDTTLRKITAEVCGCAAAYPEARGALKAFELMPALSIIGDDL